MKGKKRINPCAPKLWKKFNPAERELWMVFFQTFLKGESYPECIGDETRQVIAHNLACEAIWALRDEGNKKAA